MGCHSSHLNTLPKKDGKMMKDAWLYAWRTRIQTTSLCTKSSTQVVLQIHFDVTGGIKNKWNVGLLVFEDENNFRIKQDYNIFLYSNTWWDIISKNQLYRWTKGSKLLQHKNFDTTSLATNTHILHYQCTYCPKK